MRGVNFFPSSDDGVETQTYKGHDGCHGAMEMGVVVTSASKCQNYRFVFNASKGRSIYYQNAFLQPGIDLSAADDSYAQTTDEFTVTCTPLTIQRADPIINPGEMSGHVHTVAGGTAFQQTMDADTAKNSISTTCDREIDKSSYWIPHLYHQTPEGKFEMLSYDGSVSGLLFFKDRLLKLKLMASYSSGGLLFQQGL